MKKENKQYILTISIPKTDTKFGAISGISTVCGNKEEIVSCYNTVVKHGRAMDARVYEVSDPKTKENLAIVGGEIKVLNNITKVFLANAKKSLTTGKKRKVANKKKK